MLKWSWLWTTKKYVDLATTRKKVKLLERLVGKKRLKRLKYIKAWNFRRASLITRSLKTLTRITVF